MPTGDGVPSAVVPLPFEKPLYSRVGVFAMREERLRGGGGLLGGAVGWIAQLRFAPSAVFALRRAQPFHGAPNALRVAEARSRHRC